MTWDSYLSILRALSWGLSVTLQLAAAVIVLSTIGGVLLGLAHFLGGAIIRGLLFVLVIVVRGIPLLVHIFAVFFILPLAGLIFSPFVSAVIALTLFFSITIGEIVRGGLEGVPRGQYQAALALGFRPGAAVREIVLPQALRAVLPPLINQYVSTIKSTSLVSLVGVVELMQAGREAIDRTLATLTIFAMVWLAYTIVCYPVAALGRYLERRLNMTASRV